VTEILYGRGLVKSYGKTQALRGVTVGVGEGEIVAVTGRAAARTRPAGCWPGTPAARPR
jgi:ABC-type multidrug transport system ATPase subunit